ncbi:MAG: Trm112 family protein [Rubrivivax sp.]
MTLDHRLLDLLICPVCKGPLQAHRDSAGRLDELQCPADRLGFPVRDGLPAMLEQEARNLDTPAPAAANPE